MFCQDRLGTNVWQQRHCCCTRCRITRASRSSASPTRWQTRSVRRQQPRNNADALQLCRVLVLMQTDHLPRQAQTDANALNCKRRFVCTGTAGNELNFHSWFDPTGAKRHFLCHSYIKCIILPRQARDKHRESTQKRVAFRIVVVPHAPAGGVGTGFANPGGQVRERISMRHVYAQNDQSAKTGSG